MSYTLRCWQQPDDMPYPQDIAEALALVDLLSQQAPAVDGAFVAFARRLTARYPCICSPEGDHPSAEPAWADGPLDGASDAAVFNLALASPAVERVRPFVLAEARQLGLNVMDEQCGEVHLANGTILSVQQPADTLHAAAQAYREGRHDAAFAAYTVLAANGSAEAWYYLGGMHERGQGTAVDDDQAVSAYTQAAQGGFVRAHTRLGALYMSGKKIEQDYTAALTHLRAGAERGDKESQGLLAMMYANGRGTGKDLAQAAHWYEQAATAGDASAQLSMGLAYKNGEGVPQDIATAKKWIRMSASNGYPLAYFVMGTLYLTGLGVERHPALAFALHRYASVDNASLRAGAERLTPAERLGAEDLATAKKLRTALNLARDPLAYIEKQFGRLDQ